MHWRANSKKFKPEAVSRWLRFLASKGIRPGVPEYQRCRDMLMPIRVPLGQAPAVGGGQTPYSWEPGKEINGFMMVTGGSGSGKTEALKLIGGSLVRHGIPVITIDFHGDVIFEGQNTLYGHAPQSGGQGLNPLAIDPAALAGRGLEVKIANEVDRIGRATGRLGYKQASCLRKVITDLYREFGISDTLYSSWRAAYPNLVDIFNRLSLTFVSAGMQAGYPLNEDFNGADQYGVGLYHVFQKGGLRCSNARAYLKLARWRANLTVVTGAHVTKVLIENGVAEGVEFKRQGSMKTVRARREVILSAGAFQSPQVLMLSGVGDPAELSRFDIPVKVDLPGVGKNLQDHLDIFVETREKTKFSVSLRPETLPKMLWQAFLLLFFRKGTLTSNVAESGGFYRSGIGGEEGVPDIQWHMAVSMNAKHGLDLTRVRKYFGYSVMNYDLRPLSRGRVGLHSADPLAPPLIDPALGSHERDIDRLVYAVKETRRVLAQPAFDPHRGEETAPGPHIQTDEQLREWVRETAEVAYHPVGTCKMGPESDVMSVVDARLKVRGVKGLRVVDCSIMPTLVGGNTNQPATMIGEKGAQMILEDCGVLE